MWIHDTPMVEDHRRSGVGDQGRGVPLSVLQTELLDARLKDYRFGDVVRIALDQLTLSKLNLLSKLSDRSFQDIFRVFLAVYEHQASSFPIKRKQRTQTAVVRLSDREIDLATDRAWNAQISRSHLLGSLAEIFFARVPFKTLVLIFREQVDRQIRLQEDLRCSR